MQVIQEVKVAPICAGKPSFEDVISRQNNTGFWSSAQGPAFAAHFKDGNIEDAGVRQDLEALSVGGDVETLYVTLLAIYVLTELFEDREGEWTLIVCKAKTYLKN